MMRDRQEVSVGFFYISLCKLAGLDVIRLWVMQQRGYLVRLNKRQNFFHPLLFCSKADFVQQI